MMFAMDTTMRYLAQFSNNIENRDPSTCILLLLLELGFKPDVEGFQYLRDCILVKSQNRKLQLSTVYQTVIDQHDNLLTYNQIDQAIRNAIKNSWYKRNLEAWRILCPAEFFESNRKPSNGTVICYFASLVELWTKISYNNSAVL